jgi:hypothetical protein
VVQTIAEMTVESSFEVFYEPLLACSNQTPDQNDKILSKITAKMHHA